MQEKTVNQKGWLFVLPVLVLVAFSSVIPLMTVVNYSVQDTFGNNVFFWAGLEWFKETLASERILNALGRQAFFTAVILAIEVPRRLAQLIVATGEEEPHQVAGMSGRRLGQSPRLLRVQERGGFEGDAVCCHGRG